MELVSVIITTKNRLNYLKQAIYSVLEQTYNNYELVIVDDASTDNTQKYCENLKSKKIKYYRMDSSMGGNAARNKGIELACGEYIAFLDDDDQWVENKLEKQLEVFKNSNNLKLGLVFSSVQNINIYDEQFVFKQTIKRTFNKKNVKTDILIYNIIGNTSNPLLLKKAIIEVGKFDESLPACQEYDLWIRICQKYDIEYIPESLIKYTIENLSQNQISGNPERYIVACKIINEKYSNEIKKLSIKNKKDRNYYMYTNIYARCIKNKNKKLALRYFLKSLKLKFRVTNILKFFIDYINPKILIKIRLILKVIRLK